MIDPPARAVVVSVLEEDLARLERGLGRVPSGCGLIEIRADRLPEEEITGAVRAASRPVIVTIRTREEGGFFEGSEADRLRILERALSAGARFVDVEWEGPLASLAAGPDAARVVLSHHGAPCELERLLPLYRAMAATGAARLKIVPRAGSPQEAGVVRELLRIAGDEGRSLACFAMGRAGTATRILAPSWGSWGTYGALEYGRETGPGQLTASDLLEVHDVLRIGPATRLFALAGSPIDRSPSPVMHAAAYREAGIDARYLPIETSRIEDVVAIAGPGSVLGIEGFSVTIPLKEHAAARSHLADGWSRASGAVNTVVVEDRGWAGYNTDAPAALAIVRRGVDPSGARVAVVGAGGTARALGSALKSAGAVVTFFNRNRDRAEVVAASVGGSARRLDELPAAAWDVLVQTTPLGSQGEEVIPASSLTGRFVLDVVYGVETPLVRDARARGIGVADGFELLVEQAALQIERMTGVRARRETLREAGSGWIAARVR